MQPLADPASAPPRARPYLVGDLVESNARWTPRETAVIHRDEAHDWASLKARMDALKRGLAARGIGRGDIVAVLDRASVDFLALHYALAGMGAIMLPINAWLRAAEVAYVLDDARPRLLIHGEAFAPLAAEACAAAAAPPPRIVRGPARDGALCWEAVADGPDVPLPEPAGWDDAHMILYTSGTTGRPKGAVISHRRTILDALAVSGVLGIRRGDRMFCYLPMFHTGAWDYFKLFFIHGGSIVIVEQFEPAEAIRLVEAHRCTLMFGVPVVLREMVEHPDFATADMSSLRLIGYGSYDPSDFLTRVLDAFRARGAASIDAFFPYGLTEGGAFVAIARPGEALDNPSKIGRPVPGCDVRLLDDEGREVPVGEIGEICVRSAALMSGYLNRPEATAEAFAGGFLHTGDMGRADATGMLTLVDRKKDMIRSGGENVYAKEVEQAVVALPGVLDCAVVGAPDPDYDEMVVAFVVLRDGAPRDEAAMIAELRRRIAGFKTPKRILFRDALPKSAVGKITKQTLRQELRDAPVPAR